MSTSEDKKIMSSILVVTLVIAALGVVAYFIAQNISEESAKEQAKSTRAMKATEARIAPIGKSVAGDSAAASGEKVAMSGADVVKKTCMACHSGAFPNAPKIGDKASWTSRGDMDKLLAGAINGIPAKGMPPRGGGTYSDDELKAAIEEMMK